MKILITGACGFLGHKIYTLFKDKHEIHGTYNTHDIDDFTKLDITKAEEVAEVFDKVRPEVVIHTAALTNVDYCEDNRDEAYSVNFIGTKNILENCKKYNSKLVFISTDAVFEGKEGIIYKEEDIRSPVNHYGYTKLEAERLIEESEIDYLILRPTILYGHSNYYTKKNFVQWVVESLEAGKEINIVEGQAGHPTLIDSAARVIFQLLEKNATGKFHIVGKDFVNRYEFTQKIAVVFNLDKSLIKRVQPHEFVQKARRPNSIEMSLEKLNSLEIEIVGIDEGLKIMKEQMSSNALTR